MSGLTRYIRKADTIRGAVCRILVVLLAVQALAACGATASVTPSSAHPPTGVATTTPAPEAGSFSAFCPTIRVRLLAPPRLMQDASMCQQNSLFLIPNITDTTASEFLTVFRYTGDMRGASAAGWSGVLETFHGIDTASGDTAWSAATQPAPQAVQGTPGFIGNFARTDKGGMRYTGTLWTGQVGADTVAILGQGSADQQASLDGDMAQILRTIELDAL